LRRLKDRRQGSSERNALEKGYALDSAAAILFDFRSNEFYESLKESGGVKYAIGAMAAVSKESTLISAREGERVAETLRSMLQTEGISTTYRMQGSVALDIHIEGHSDVDMLIIHNSVILYEAPALTSCSYVPSTDKRNMVDIISELRLASELKLTSRYWQADVNCTGSKSISLSGGSLQRKIDIVPSCWHDNLSYQKSQSESDRGIRIYNKAENKLEGNLPFLHMRRVNDRDSFYNGNLKRTIRLLKNIVADMPDYKKRIVKNLSSYDLASIAYHIDSGLKCPTYMCLTLVEAIRVHLTKLATSKELRENLIVPDGTRKIFNTPEKTDALCILEKEVSDLAIAIAKDINPLSTNYNPSTINNKYIFMG
jgi:hypothetical protein